jgi:hypothetical protein
MKWIVIGFVSAVLMLSVMFSAGFEFIGLERQPSAPEAVPTALR